MNKIPKRALIIEGGGMRGSHSAGALWAMALQGITDFDVVCATSAGACSAAYFIAKQFDKAEVVWSSYMPSRHFISLQNLFSRKPLMNLDYLLNHVFRGKDKIDVEAVRNSKTLFYITATDCETGKTVYFNNHEHDILNALKATTALPFVYNHPVVINGRRYMDGGLTDPIPVQKALDEGCQEIWLLLTRPHGFRKKPPLLKILPALYKKEYPALAEVISSQTEIYNRAVARVERRQIPCKMIVIQPEERLPISRLNSNRKRILDAMQRGYRDALYTLHELQLLQRSSI